MSGWQGIMGRKRQDRRIAMAHRAGSPKGMPEKCSKKRIRSYSLPMEYGLMVGFVGGEREMFVGR